MTASSQADHTRPGVLRAAMLVPLAAFVAVGVLLAAGLTLNPREIPSPLIGKPVPQFVLPRERLVPLHGLNYKDRPEDAQKWLDELGDPYTRTGADLGGRVAIDWGVYGVPETFVIDREGRIAYKHIGPVTPQLLRETLLPLIAKLRQ